MSRSWIIQPSYQPLSLLITNNPEISVKMSINARGSVGSVGRPGLGSNTTRTAPTVGRPTVGASDRQLCGVIDTGDDGREDVGFKTGCIKQVVLEQLASAIGFSINL